MSLPYNVIKKQEKIHYIIHISDIHIRTGNIVQARYNEYLYVFKDLLGELKKYKDIKNSIIVITGDIFHHKNQIESSGIDLFSYIIKQLTDLTEVFMIMGNHDYRQDNSVEQDLISALVNNSNYKNLYYLEKSGIYVVNNILFGLVAINDVLEDGDTSGMVECLPEFPDPNIVDLTNIDYKIALYHGIIIDDNNSFFKEKDKGIHVDWFKKYDIALLGDNHKQQINNVKNINDDEYDLTERINNKQPIWGYSGSLIQQNFGESIKHHGYLLWNLMDKTVKPYDIKNNTAYCTFSFKDDKKNKDKDWFKNIEEFINFIETNNYTTLNIRFLSNEKCINISEITNILEEKQIMFNRFYYNDSLLKNETHKTNNKNMENLNVISSYNSPNKWYEYIEQHGDTNIIGDYDWKNVLNNPEKLQLDVDKVPDILKTKVEDRNKKLLNIISKYINSIDLVDNKTSNLKLEYLEWSWILCYEENCWFNFETMDNNVGLLNADNGYGKSSFLEIICLVLFGEPMPSRHNKQLSSSIICQQKPKNSASRVKLIFTLDNKKYVLSRKFNYQKNISKLQMQNELHYVNDNNLVKLKSGNAVKEWISINIGNINTFLISSMLTQNSDKDFFSMKYSDQINLLDKALSLDSINVLVDLLKQTRLAYNNINEALEVQYLEVNSSNIDEITEDDVNEYYNLMNNTKTELKTLQELSYEKLKEVNNKVKIKDDSDFNFTDEEIKDKIDNINSNNTDIDINSIHNEKGKIETKLKDVNSNITDLKLTLESNKNDSSRIYSSRSILWELNNLYDRKSCERSKDDVHRWGENLTSSQLKEIEQEYLSCKKYFEKTQDTMSIEELKGKIDKNYEELKGKQETLKELNKDLENIKSTNDIYNKNINSNLKDQKHISKKISKTLDECNELLNEYIKMESKIEKKKLLLENNNNVLEKLDLNNKEILRLNEDIEDITKSIKDIKDAEYPFNPNCECCKAQPWKLLLVDLEKKLKKNIKKQKELESIFKKNDTSTESYIKIKRKQLVKNIDKFSKYIDTYQELKDNKENYEEQKEAIIKYNEIETKINKFEKLLDENTSKIKDLEKNKTQLNNQINKIEDKLDNYNKKLELKLEYDNWNLRKTKNEEDIKYYYWICDNIMDKYEEIIKRKEELESVLEEYTKNIENIELKEYWRNILETKSLWKEYNDIKTKIDRKSNYLNNVSNKYVNIKKDFNSYKKIVSKRNEIEKVLEEFKNTSEILNHFSEIFGNFRNWLYKNKIIPLIVNNTNEIINKVANNEKDILKIDTVWNDNESFYWTINDGNNKPNIEKASGFQRFIAGLAIKITLSNIGISNLQCNQLFIDEGFTSCDRGHLSKVPVFINSLLNLYDSVLVVSHLQEIKDSVSIIMNIDRNKEKSLSKITYGNKININQNKLEF